MFPVRLKACSSQAILLGTAMRQGARRGAHCILRAAWEGKLEERSKAYQGRLCRAGTSPSAGGESGCEVVNPTLPACTPPSWMLK